MELALLAEALTFFLAPALPYLLKLGDQAAEEAVKKLGADTWTKAKGLWAKLRPRVEAKPAALDTARDLAQAPEEEDAREALRYQLQKLLAADPELADEVERQLEEAGALHVYQARLEGSGAIAQGPGAVAAGERGVAIGGSVHGSRLDTGDRPHRPRSDRGDDK